MAIINTLEKCLESPYLFADPAAPSRVPGLLEQAQGALEAAGQLLQAAKPDATDVGTLAYQSMFAAVRALVYARGYREAGLKCLVLACDAFYVRPGMLDSAQLVALEQVQGFKLPPAAAVAAAAELLAAAERLVGSVQPAQGRA